MRTSLAVGAVALALTACRSNDGPGPNPVDEVIRLAVGQTHTRTGSQGASIEVSGGAAGGEFVLIPFYGSTAAASTIPLEFSATQVTATAGPPTPEIGPAGGVQLSRASSTEALSAAARFHTSLRRLERGELGRRLAAARAARNAAGTSPLYSTSAAAAPPAVGDPMTLNTHINPCDSVSNRTGRVVAVTERAVIVADNANPSGGFTDEEYLAIAQEFDALVYPTITQNFGEPTDIDQNANKRSVIFYTRAVNEMTPARSDFVISGFFHPRDLFPRTATQTLPACATSNYAEMFYMLVPDPNGEVNNNVRTKESVRRGTVGVLAHEFQHLINASRRMYVNNANDFEDVWLNEGLSHIAEELMFYRASGLAPKQNIDLAMLRSSQTILDAVNAYQVSNLARLIDYLENPEANSPYGSDDSLATRGATWQLLRYAADRSSKAQQAVWFELANSRNAGVTNATAVFGGTFVDLVRDWATAQYTDDAVSTTAVFQHPSWNYRSVIPVLINRTNPPPYPLKTRPLVAGTPLSLTLKGGSAAYLRFGIGGGATATITATSSGAALPTPVSLTVVRTR